MRKWIFLAVLLGFSSQGRAFVQSREVLDQEAKAQFLQLHFFSQGRGMHLVPDFINLYGYFQKLGIGQKFLQQKIQGDWGFNVVDGRVVGLFNVPYKNMHVGVLGCVACHSGKAAGQFIPGLGNKNVDVLKVGQDAKLLQKLYLKFRLPIPRSEEYKKVSANALEFAKTISDESIANQTQGLVPVSFIRTWFYKQAGETWSKDMARGAVKVPALWGYEEKREVGQFSDGFGNGKLPGWAIAVELTAGQSPEVAREYMKRVEEAEHLFSYFLPPKYPFPTDDNLILKGKMVFEKNCSGCHGSYQTDASGLPIYEAPKHIPLSVVRTDADRLKANTQKFYTLVEENPLSEFLQANHYEPGYFAPRLVGIWSRFPYLHNASVPTLMDLLSPPNLRPTLFDLRDSGELESFDLKRVGLKLQSSSEVLLREAKKNRRSIYWTARAGQSNEGHDFGTALSQAEKEALIEYLKTL